jgi:hypothetical protein
MNQNRNWVGSHAAPASANSDKELQTHFGDVGLDYQFNNNWGATAELPYWDRLFRTDIGTPSAPDVTTFRHSAIGDVRLNARYTGFSSDLSTGLTLGVKLPSGDWTYRNFDRDSSIGTGTTDLLLGGYHVGGIGAGPHLKWFAEILFDRPFNTREGYRPGNEVDAAVGALYDGIRLGQSGSLATLLQLIGSDRLHDSGVRADPYNRAIIACCSRPASRPASAIGRSMAMPSFAFITTPTPHRRLRSRARRASWSRWCCSNSW